MALTQIKSSNIADGTVAAADIADDSIINADIKSDAAIDISKLAGSIPASKLASALDLSGKTVTLPAVSVTAHALPAEIGFSNVSTWADSAVETVTLSPVATGIGKAQVAVYEEIPDANKTNATWDITANDTGFDLIDSAYTQTLTPAATTGDSIAFTLGGGSWVAADIGKRIVNVSTSEAGVARIVSIVSTVATCIITTAFTDTNAIASGDWELYAGDFDADGKFALSNATIAGGASIGQGLQISNSPCNYPSSCTIDTDKVLVIYQDEGTSPANRGRAQIITNTNGVLSYGTKVEFPGSQFMYYNAVTALSTTQAIAVFRSEHTNDTGGACVINISGTTVTFGSIHNFTNSPHYFGYPSVDKLSSTTAVCSWPQAAVPKGCDAVILSVSGSTVSSGSVVRMSGTFSVSSSTDTQNAVLSSSKFLTTWIEGTNLRGCVGTVSGTTITKGTEQTISTTAIYGQQRTKALSSSSVAIVYGHDASGHPNARIFSRYLTVSGTVITINAETTISDKVPGSMDLVVLSPTELAFAYVDYYTTNAMNIKSNRFGILTLSGTTFTLGDTISIGRVDSPFTMVGFATSNPTEFAYIYRAGETDNTNKPQVRLINLAGPTTCSSYPSWWTRVGGSQYDSTEIQYPDITSLDTTTGVIVYRDQDNSNKATAVHYTVDLTTRLITFGTPLTFMSLANSDYVRVDRLSATKVIAVFAYNSDAYAHVLTVSGTTLTSGAQLVMFDGTYPGTHIEQTDVCALSETQALGVYLKGSSCCCVVLNISGTTITKGSDVVYEPSDVGNFSNKVCKLSSTKAIVTYTDDGNSAKFTACVIDVSGSTATPGTPQVIDNGAGSATASTALAGVSSTKAVCSYLRDDNPDIPYMRILTISGTTITMGTAVTFAPATSGWKQSLAVINESEVFVTYQEPVSGSGEYKLIDISTTTPVADTLHGNIFSEEQTHLFEMCPLYGSTSDAVIVYKDGRTDDGYVVAFSKLSAPLYASSQYVTTISGTDSVDTTYYSDWNSNTITETLGGQSAYYAFSVNSTPSAAEVTGGTFLVVGSGQTATRNIVSSLSSVHGGTAGVWYKNTNATYGSETWAAATTNEAKAAIQEATATAANQMNGTAFAAISDANLPAFGTQMSVAMTLYSADSAVSPTIDGVSFNYDGNVINRLETDAYTVEMPTTAAIQVTAPSSGGPRNARVYVSS